MSRTESPAAAAGRCLRIGSDATFELLAERFRALADPLRLRLVQLLLEEEHSVGELARLAAATASNVSRHLHVLAEVGVVSRRREGLQAFYTVTDPAVAELCERVCHALEEQLARQAELIRTRA